MNRPPAFVRKLDLDRGVVELAHGGGGKATAQLVAEVFAPHLDDAELRQADDAALLDLGPGKLVVSTDAFVVSPLFFPGGDIGHLAVHGSVNDIAMRGAKPRHLTASFILEEGLPLSTLSQIARSLASAARQCGISLVAADTKVTERGKADGVFITTTGLGLLPPGRPSPSGSLARPGDAVLVSGPVGDHGLAVLCARGGLSALTGVTSDTAPLHDLVDALFAADPRIHTLRDLTRGGLAAALNEIAHQSCVGMHIDEQGIPLRREVRAASELLGVDPLNAACEGRLVCICAHEASSPLLAAMRSHPAGAAASLIGHVTDDPRHRVVLTTPAGGRRTLLWPTADDLPRIC